MSYKSDAEIRLEIIRKVEDEIARAEIRLEIIRKVEDEIARQRNVDSLSDAPSVPDSIWNILEMMTTMVKELTGDIGNKLENHTGRLNDAEWISTLCFNKTC